MQIKCNEKKISTRNKIRTIAAILIIEPVYKASIDDKAKAICTIKLRFISKLSTNYRHDCDCHEKYYDVRSFKRFYNFTHMCTI